MSPDASPRGGARRVGVSSPYMRLPFRADLLFFPGPVPGPVARREMPTAPAASTEKTLAATLALRARDVERRDIAECDGASIAET